MSKRRPREQEEIAQDPSQWQSWGFNPSALKSQANLLFIILSMIALKRI